MIRLVLVFATLAIHVPAAAAQDRGALHEPYLALGLNLGFGGEVELETENVSGGGGSIMVSGTSAEADADLAVGGSAQYMVPLLRFFALGGKLAIQSWESEFDADGGRNLAFDLALVPQGRVQLTNAVELYLAVPLGLTLNLLNQFEGQVGLGFGIVNASASVEADAGFGFNLGALLGARFAVSSDFGLFTELGYAMHSVSHELTGRAGVAGVAGAITIDVDVAWWQIGLNAGVYF